MTAVTFLPTPGADTNGEPVLISATASTGNTIHTATSSAEQWDSVWLWLHNGDTEGHTAHVEWGGTASKNLVSVDIPPHATVLVAQGWRLRGGKIVRVYADTTNVIRAIVNVDRLTDNA